MKKGESKLKDAMVAAIDILIALSLYQQLDSLLQDINVISVPFRLSAFLSYFGLGIILSILSVAGLVNLIKISKQLTNILALFAAIILLLSGVFVISIIPYE